MGGVYRGLPSMLGASKSPAPLGARAALEQVTHSCRIGSRAPLEQIKVSRGTTELR